MIPLRPCVHACAYLGACGYVTKGGCTFCLRLCCVFQMRRAALWPVKRQVAQCYHAHALAAAAHAHALAAHKHIHARTLTHYTRTHVRETWSCGCLLGAAPHTATPIEFVSYHAPFKKTLLTYAGIPRPSPTPADHVSVRCYTTAVPPSLLTILSYTFIFAAFRQILLLCTGHDTPHAPLSVYPDILLWCRYAPRYSLCPCLLKAL